MNSPFTYTKEDAILALWRDGKTESQIAETLGLPFDDVQSIIDFGVCSKQWKRTSPAAVPKARKGPKPTTTTARDLQTAYDVFNEELFGGELPECLITYQRKKQARGYFWPTRFAPVGDVGAGELVSATGEPGATPTTQEDRLDEIALNPEAFQGHPHHGASCPEEDVLSTLLHEMIHLWQFRRAPKKPTPGYHDKVWANKMEALGLMPSTTGQPGGKRTGQQCTHYIIPGGPFQRVYQQHLKGKILLFADNGGGEYSKKRKAAKKASKTKYTCPECNANAWAKPNTALICGDCECGMVSEDTELPRSPGSLVFTTLPAPGASCAVLPEPWDPSPWPGASWSISGQPRLSSESRKRVRDAQEMAGAVRRFLRALVARGNQGQEIALLELVDLQASLQEAQDQVARSLRAQGHSWTYLGNLTGMSKQAARKRWGRPGETSRED